MYFINTTSEHSAVKFAAEELKKYLFLMTGEDAVINGKEVGFTLGLMSEFGLDAAVSDIRYDDVIYIDTTETDGIIAGSNPRSVLIAVYEYLRQNGCRWFYPGRSGECIPRKAPHALKYRHAPRNRFRGPCIEGSVSQRNVLDMIDFLPKVGMNTFMSQFLKPTVFYQRKLKTPTTDESSRIIGVDEVVAYKKEFEGEVAKRGLGYQDMGHGWCVLPFGISADSWHLSTPEDFAPEDLQYTALVGGKRGFIREGAPLVIQPCLSNTEGRRRIATYVADFAARHPYIEVLHVWLGDGSKNHCECEECRKKTASDWYVIFLNELDEILTERRLDTRIGFAEYSDTVFAPECESLKNPERFVMTFAPITREYTKTLTGHKEPMRRYVRNGDNYLRTLDDYLQYFEAWQDVQRVDSFAFEYHFWRYALMDMTGLDIARRIFEDIRLYDSLGFSGLVACGSLRQFFPSALPFYVMARALYDESVGFEELLDEFLAFCYGKEAKKYCDYLYAVREIFDFEYMLAKKSIDASKTLYYDPDRAEKFRTVPSLTAKMREDATADMKNAESDLERLSLRLFLHYADYLDAVAKFLYPVALGDLEGAKDTFAPLLSEWKDREREIDPYFDAWLTLSYIERIKRTTDKFW